MSVVALCSAGGAPGVTTAALALGWVWPTAEPGRRVLVVDADPAGSGVVPGWAQAGVASDGGVLALAASRLPVTADTLLEHCLTQDADARRLVLTGVGSSAQARTLAPIWRAIADAATDLDTAGVDVVVDAGRLGHRYEPTVLLERADVVALVLSPTLSSVATGMHALHALREVRGPAATTTALVVAGGGPYGAGEIGRELGLDSVPVLAHDPWAARALADAATSGWRFDRSPLLRSATTLARHLRALIAPVKTRV
ncbi:hypothetical protein [Cellulomonas carbonis]|uniref:MinD-like ATPase involved in chromosome partitioning or flagellar assembly n=1 Tax=Cellulomonas carbonis T26 TaxID=947969 RepID=A0A0A0BTZ9_9CELL|nr:hypothetical protein [Cellulomonas carbonis]KGM11878.1 hypothetical protein N868_04905 [Cellulomonas carbonis T26]GGB91542.1 hypothetical protein GCM10010972_00210 [Cellulomonas carbonis]